MLHLRILSALVGIPLILGLVYLGGSYYALFMLLVAILGIREYTAFLKRKCYHLPTWVGYAGLALFMSMLFLGAVLERELILPALIIIMMSLGILQLIYFGKASLHELALILWGIIYLGGFGGYMILLRQLPQGLTYTLVLLVG